VSEGISDVLDRVRREIYRVFATSGRAPSRAEVAVAVGLGFDEVEAAFSSLADHQLIVLGDYAQVELALPFASLNLGFSVSGAHALWWGASALDSFAIPHLVEAEPSVLIATTCPGCQAALAWTVTRATPPSGEHVAYFPTPAKWIWDDILGSSRNQRIFCDSLCVDSWFGRRGGKRGEIVGLNTLWRLAAHWHDGIFESPFSRRGPDEVAAYFGGLGLTGEFWGATTELPRRQGAHAADG
jgi:hypothetical protein